MTIVLQLNKKGLLKIISLFLLVFFIACAAKISYKGEKNQDGKYHGKGIITFINGEQWAGEFMVNHIMVMVFIYGLIVQDMREKSLKGCIKVRVHTFIVTARSM